MLSNFYFNLFKFIAHIDFKQYFFFFFQYLFSFIFILILLFSFRFQSHEHFGLYYLLFSLELHYFLFIKRNWKCKMWLFGWTNYGSRNDEFQFVMSGICVWNLYCNSFDRIHLENDLFVISVWGEIELQLLVQSSFFVVWHFLLEIGFQFVGFFIRDSLFI